MKREVEKIISETTLSMLDLINLHEELQQRIVNENLINGLAETIINNIDTLPIQYIYRTDDETGNKVYRAIVNIISDKELERLRLIEKAYINEQLIKPV